MAKVKRSSGATHTKKAAKKPAEKKSAEAQTKKTETKKTAANNHDMKSSKLSDREKEMQNDIKNGKGEIDVKSGDKVGNAARAMADKDGNGELSETETESLQANAKAILDKNPELSALAEKNGLDPNNPDDLDAIMQLQLEEANLPDDKLKVPNSEEVEEAKEAIDESNEELPPPEDEIEAKGVHSNCNTPHEDDMIAQISKLVNEGYEALKAGDCDKAASLFQEAISKGTTQLEKEINGGTQEGGEGKIIDPADNKGINQKGALNSTQQKEALTTLAKSNPIINQAMQKAKESPRIQKLLDLMAYASKRFRISQKRWHQPARKKW